MRYNWEEQKNAANFRKHGIGFAQAARIFEGEILQWPDERYHYDEERWIAIGLAQGQEVFVVYVEESDDVCRIVSARPATRDERALYWRYAGQQDRLGASAADDRCGHSRGHSLRSRCCAGTG